MKTYEFSEEEAQEVLVSLAVTANKWRRSLENEINAGMSDHDRESLARRLSVVQGVRTKLGAVNIKPQVTA